jgi:hypothetical protein
MFEKFIQYSIIISLSIETLQNHLDALLLIKGFQQYPKVY